MDGVLFAEARRWWGKVYLDEEWTDVELDVVAESQDHKTLLIGECKWSSGENARLPEDIIGLLEEGNGV